MTHIDIISLVLAVAKTEDPSDVPLAMVKECLRQVEEAHFDLQLRSLNPLDHSIQPHLTDDRLQELEELASQLYLVINQLTPKEATNGGN